eukprot:6180610-Pleurochrysis_carterae.AAC.2
MQYLHILCTSLLSVNNKEAWTSVPNTTVCTVLLPLKGASGNIVPSCGKTSQKTNDRPPSQSAKGSSNAELAPLRYSAMLLRGDARGTR